LPAGVTNLHVLDLFFNQLTNLNLPADLRNLLDLDLDNNQLTSLNLPANLTGLVFLRARSNQLTNFNLPSDLTGLTLLDIGENQLRSVNLPVGLGHLINLRISGNTNLTSLTLPMGMTIWYGPRTSPRKVPSRSLPAWKCESLPRRTKCSARADRPPFSAPSARSMACARSSTHAHRQEAQPALPPKEG